MLLAAPRWCCWMGLQGQAKIYMLCSDPTLQRCEAAWCNIGSAARHTSDSLHAWFWINFWLLCFRKPFTAAKVFSTSTVNYVVTHSIRSWAAGGDCWEKQSAWLEEAASQHGASEDVDWYRETLLELREPGREVLRVSADSPPPPLSVFPTKLAVSGSRAFSCEEPDRKFCPEHAVLGVELTTSGTLGEHSTNWATSPASCCLYFSICGGCFLFWVES